MKTDEEEFYIGYLKSAPEKLGKSTRRRVFGLLCIALLTGILVTALQFRFWPGTYEFGNTRSFEGIVMEHPYPTLLIERKGDTSEGFPYSRFLLVSQGKFGAEKHVEGMNGQPVRLDGQLIYQDGKSMIEIVEMGVKPLGNRGEITLPSQNLGTFTLKGEIVDSKCYLGVMNPGNLKTHKACAIRCISGGIPPVFLVRGTEGAVLYFLLVDEEGGKVNKRVLDRVAENLEITGNVTLEGGMLVLHSDPSGYKRF